MFQVTVMNAGSKFWLGGTVWRFAADRATTHETVEAAKAALVKAKPFMAAKVYRAAVIEPV
jgi:hypothetical protein